LNQNRHFLKNNHNIEPWSLQLKPFSERFGIALSQSGVAITITSVTDIVAFAVGSSSNLPGKGIEIQELENTVLLKKCRPLFRG
jgi:hypothetical protein